MIKKSEGDINSICAICANPNFYENLSIDNTKLIRENNTQHRNFEY